MMKGKFLGTLVILAAFATAVFTGCDSPTGNEPEPTTFTVTFNSAGGSAVPAQTGLEFGATATAPTPPTRAWHPAAGLWLSSDWDELPETSTFTFGGWRHGNETWNFATDTVTENITLTAHWTAPTVEVSPIGEVEANDVAAAVEHVNANAGAFTLAIDEDISTPGTPMFFVKGKGDFSQKNAPPLTAPGPTITHPAPSRPIPWRPRGRP